jgi:SAM-dependent methyltransferase
MTAPIDYAPGDLAILAGLEARHFWFRARRRIILDALARWFPHAQNYLEIGCGAGYNVHGIANAFPEWRIVASDALEEGIAITRGLNARGVALVCFDARQVPFEKQFDVVGSYDVLEHVADHADVLRQFRKACRAGGGILLTVPQHPRLWSTADVLARHHRRYTKSELRQLVEAAGFQVAGCTSFNTLNLPLLALRSSFLRATGRAPRAVVPAAPANWLMERCMDADRLLIGAGFNLPAGGSLLLAARVREGVP